ncbi:MAG: putative signal transducing protein [Bacteroidota bacterium]
MKDDLDLVTVLETSSEPVIAIVKSILDGAEIPYFIKGEGLQNLFGTGTIGLNLAGPALVQVRREDELEARTLLEGIGESDFESEEEL